MTMLQSKTPHLTLCGQHKLDLMGIIFLKIYLFIIYYYFLFMCTSVLPVCTDLDEGLRSPRTGVTDCTGATCVLGIESWSSGTAASALIC